jgi:hypothetical protein
MNGSRLQFNGPAGRQHLLILLGIWLLLAACSSQQSEPTPTQGVYRPPTQAITATPLPIATPEIEVERPTPEPACTNALWFFQDLTLPDGTQVSPGERLDKRWLVQNAGTCNWDARYQVRLEGGPNMGVPAVQALFPARSGLELTIRMNFVAPDEPGIYRSAWQAYDPDGAPFGDPFFIEIEVVDSPASESDQGG